MTEEEQNNNERKEPPARKAKTGAWWKSVRATAETAAMGVTPPQPAASVHRRLAPKPVHIYFQTA